MENQRTMEEVLKLQRDHYLNEGPPSYELRIDRLDRVKDMVIQNKERITEALNADFGTRSPNQSLISNVNGTRFSEAARITCFPIFPLPVNNK